MSMSSNTSRIKEGDVIEVLYEGYVANTKELFDTNIKEVAKKYGKDSENIEYKPFIVVVGKRMVIKGMDDAFKNKEIGKEYEVEISPKDGFGEYDPKKIKILPYSAFKKQKINPIPGSFVYFENDQQAKVLSISSGRVKVDFNHPLAGKKLYYKFKITRKITDVKEKFLGIFRTIIGRELINNVEFDKETKTLKVPKKYENLKIFIEGVVKEYLNKDIKNIEFVEVEENNTKENTADNKK